MVDALSFVDVELPQLINGAQLGTGSRQIALNGSLLTDIVDGQFSTLLVEGVSATEQLRYLASLLGETSPGELEEGRVTLGFCDVCLDNDGWLLGVSLEIGTELVSWKRVGFDMENGFPLSYTGRWWKRTVVEPPADWKWWLHEPRDPELSYEFNRSHYEAAIAAEIERIGSQR